MELPQSSKLKVKYLSRLFDNTTECNKFFWFQAIITKVLEDKKIITYEELIDEMVVESWYMVTEYHLKLGPKDTLEALVHDIQSISGIKPTEKKESILGFLRICTDKGIIKKKRSLIRYVPYRLQSPFMDSMKADMWNVPKGKLIEQINQYQDLIYYIGEFKGMDTVIYIQEGWYQYFHENQEIIKGWLQFNIVRYLQKRNPNVPGIVDKLTPPEKRNLGNVIQYWKVLLNRHPHMDIYGHVLLEGKHLSIDHFIPWSYVAHDEFWNLNPTTRSINSQKSNRLPDWDIYFPEFASLQYFSYQMIFQDDVVKNEFKKCEKEYLNNLDIEKRLYREGQNFTEFASALEEVVRPVYLSAEDCGFAKWTYQF